MPWRVLLLLKAQLQNTITGEELKNFHLIKIEILHHIFFSQLRELLEDEPEKLKEVLDMIKQFRDEEQEHHDIGLENDAEKVKEESKYLKLFQVNCLINKILYFL